MRNSRLTLALQSGALVLPASGRIAVWRPVAGDDLSPLPRGRVTVLTGFRPDHDHFRDLGWETAPDASPDAPPPAVPPPAAPYVAGLVCLTRSRAQARALLARAADEVAPGGPIAVDGQKTDGIDSILRELGRRVPLSEPIAKAHGKIAVFAAGPGLEDWRARDRDLGGFVTRPGVFSADGPDRGSELLAQALPERLGPWVVDLGAGWGYLGRAILAREGVRHLDLVEAEAEALACARRNITDPRARFHWEDARSFRPGGAVDAVVANPPFHTGRRPDPALGEDFVAAAARMLAPGGTLWLVANRHLPYDRALAANFSQVEAAGGDASFRIIRATRPRRAGARGG